MTCDDAGNCEDRQRGTVAEGSSGNTISDAAYPNTTASDNAHSAMRCQLKIRKNFNFESRAEKRNGVRYFNHAVHHRFCDGVALSDCDDLTTAIGASESPCLAYGAGGVGRLCTLQPFET